ncbi:MAG: mycothiol synthase, partial [Nocardioidaceae bacterium]
LAAEYGWERVRDLWLMRRSLRVELPDVSVPEGPGDTVIRTWRPGDEDQLLAVNASAFAHHPEQGALTRAGLDERLGSPWFDPAGLFLAVAPDGGLLGFHWTKVHDDDPSYGEVYVVGVSPDAQGGGLGAALTARGLRYLHDRGLGEVVLYVEADNRPALRTYERLGFTHADADTDVMYRRS